MIRKKGLTLIELLITMGLIGSILVVITSVYLVGFRTFREELASSTVQSGAQTILDAVVTDVKNGMLIEQSYTSDDKTYTTGHDPEMIIIRVPAMNSSQQIIYDGTDMAFDRLIYYYLDNEIHKVTFANPASVRYKNNGNDAILDKHALSLSFAYDPDQFTATLVTVTLKSNIQTGNRNKEITISGSARLRNHI